MRGKCGTGFGIIGRRIAVLAAFLCLSAILAAAVTVSAAGVTNPASGRSDAREGTARPSENGRLHVEGTQLVDGTGVSVQLRGVSTHGLTWFPQFVDPELFRQLSEDWDANLIRLAMYSEVYCKGAKEESLELLRKGIDAALAADMYVLVDWHILEDGDPNTHAEEAAAFFDLISSEYAGIPNLLYEICNEPNGETGWADVLSYGEQIIPVIRRNDPDAVIIAGTPEFSRNLGSAVLRPLAFDNIMYTLHFYAASHREGLREELRAALDAGLPVFVTECGLTESTGDGRIDFGSASAWFRYLNEKSISYAVWSLSDKSESSAIFRKGFRPGKGIADKDLTAAGSWAREVIRGADPETIPVPAQILEKDRLSVAASWVADSLGERGYRAVNAWKWLAAFSAVILGAMFAAGAHYRRSPEKKLKSYDDLAGEEGKEARSFINGTRRMIVKILLTLSIFFTLIYLCWRIIFSVPVQAGAAAVAANLILLAVEVLGFIESMILFFGLLGRKKHPLPKIADEEYPEVDVFVATYNEPTELLRRTINGCVHMKYPDRSRVHIWICDDNRRPQMRALAEEMGVGYFDRPDNKGAKAGNLNSAFARTHAPYVVTFDADMIPKSDFLLKTIPYFVDAEKKNRKLPPEKQIRLGFLQTPQCFYDPDLFQHALYSEKRVPNEQDFFYRSIEPAKTSTNSVIYGGSNTVLSRRALEDIGGFYTGSITEDFATGILIEAKGYVSLAIPEPLASGQTPHEYRDHIKQRTRWGRGVIASARQLDIRRIEGLSLPQKISYWSSVVYWYSPVKNLIYILSPLLFAVLAVPVLRCNWLELLVFWLPMFILQDISLIAGSKKTISQKWSGIYETSVMPHMLLPILQETFGVSLTTFKVTEKTKGKGRRTSDLRAMAPFIVLIALSLIGIARVLYIFDRLQAISLLILLFWLVRNLYFLILALFLVDGRDSDTEPVRVTDAVPVTVRETRKEQRVYEGVTTALTEHSVKVFLDEGETLDIGAPAEITIDSGDHRAVLQGVVTDVLEARKSGMRTQTIEILDFGSDLYEFWEILYDRIPSLPQSLTRDFGIFMHLWQNIAHRVARTRK